MQKPCQTVPKVKTVRNSKKQLKLAVAKDEAFSFVYNGNMRALAEHPEYEVIITYFSPLRDRQLPDCDLLYLPGGYPELYMKDLSENKIMKESIRNFCNRGGRVLAECGGMLYLCESIDGFDMCGVLPLKATMNEPRLHLGYRRVEIGDMIIRGHEFHYSDLVDSDCIEFVGCQFNARGNKTDTKIFRQGNVIAGYTHLYWGEQDILKLWNL